MCVGDDFREPARTVVRRPQAVRPRAPPSPHKRQLSSFKRNLRFGPAPDSRASSGIGARGSEHGPCGPLRPSHTRTLSVSLLESPPGGAGRQLAPPSDWQGRIGGRGRGWGFGAFATAPGRSFDARAVRGVRAIFPPKAFFTCNTNIWQALLWFLGSVY